MKNIFAKFVSAFTIVALFVFLVGPQLTYATGPLSKISDTMSRQAVSTLSSHTIAFKTTAAIAAGGTIAINFATFTGTPVFGDVNVCHGPTGLEHGTSSAAGFCAAAGETMASSAGATTIWGASYGSNTLTLTAPTGTPTYPLNAGDVITVFISNAHLTNPSSTATPNITIVTPSDSGSFTVPILDSDQVAVTASVNQTLSFNIKTGTTNTGSQPYSVPLGQLQFTTVGGSGASSVPYIWANLSTNAASGMAVTVVSANAALKSTSTPGDTIPSATATMANGTANYGLCIVSVSQASGATLTKGTNFPSTTCTATPAGNTVTSVTITPQSIVTASGLISTGVAQIALDAENSASTPAHNDYGDTLTFIGTATF
ncbi:MAG: hypothetical protein P4L63_01130 [Candidatus Pacebacteria bacterium]|nr:hypothetical protein [Candidatus Paceibacterota bacterium]